MTRDQLSLSLLNVNVRAFLRVIRSGETAQTEDAYRWLYGSTAKKPKLFESFDDHPRVRTYEKNDEFIANGKVDYTTAAGAYQITETTYNALCKQYGFTGFSPETQDLMAIALIAEKSALGHVVAGKLQPAIAMCCRIWASLPGSPWGQTTNSYSHAKATFLEFGGDLHETAPQPASDDQATQVAPAPQTTPHTPATPAATPSEDSMIPIIAAAAANAPFLLSLAARVVELFSPIAREKITKEMNRHTDNPEVGAQIADGVLATIQTIAGKADPLEAYVAVKADPTMVAAVERDVLADLAKMAPMLDKIAELDKVAWDAEEASRNAAALRVNNQDLLLTRSIVAMVAVMLAVIAGMIGLLAWLKVEATIISGLAALFTTLAGTVIGKFSTRYDYAYGSSRSSGAKDVLINELSKARP